MYGGIGLYITRVDMGSGLSHSGEELERKAHGRLRPLDMPRIEKPEPRWSRSGRQWWTEQAPGAMSCQRPIMLAMGGLVWVQSLPSTTD